MKSEDLERVGLAKPAVRRLLDAVKKRRKKKGLLDKVRIMSIKCVISCVYFC